MSPKSLSPPAAKLLLWDFLGLLGDLLELLEDLLGLLGHPGAHVKGDGPGGGGEALISSENHRKKPIWDRLSGRTLPGERNQFPGNQHGHILPT